MRNSKDHSERESKTKRERRERAESKIVHFIKFSNFYFSNSTTALDLKKCYGNREKQKYVRLSILWATGLQNSALARICIPIDRAQPSYSNNCLVSPYSTKGYYPKIKNLKIW